MIEIERKFLVISNEFKKMAFQQLDIRQGYLNSSPERSVRIRIQNESGFITIKGKSKKNGLERFEWEKEIPLDEARILLKLCEPSLIEKTRFLVKFENHLFEVDEFYGENGGLLLAEIELKSEGEYFSKPDWLGKEVTGIVRYYNSSLSKMPFSRW